ncbi:TPA: hypothetical protein ACH681_005414, partial [Escherichia coli]
DKFITTDYLQQCPIYNGNVPLSFLIYRIRQQGRLSTIKRSKGYQQRFVRQLAELSRSSETPALPGS